MSNTSEESQLYSADGNEKSNPDQNLDNTESITVDAETEVNPTSSDEQMDHNDEGKENVSPDTFDTTFNSSSTESSQRKRKNLKLTPEKSLSFAIIGSKKVQIADEDPTVSVLDKTPDGRAYIAEPRPHRSKQSKRVIPGVELLSR